MEFKGSKTEEILRKSLNAELRQSFEYQYFARVARQNGLQQVAEIFEATSANELEHACHEYEFLEGAGNPLENLRQSADRERDQADKYYLLAAETAQQEGFTEIANFFRRIARVEAKHEQNFRELLSGMEKESAFEGRTVGHSALEMAQLMLPEQANPAGFVHGGELMKLMDSAAAVVAARHAHSNVVTGLVEDIIFKTPVRVGSMVVVKAKLIFASHSSMVIRVDVEMEHINLGQDDVGHEHRVPALTANFMMVAVGPDGKATSIPHLILLTEEEERLFAIAEERYKARKK
ncbi:MAG: ferritin family protein [Smithella sp.]